MEEKKVVLKLDNIDKHFGPTHANNHVCMELYAGEIRGFAGENGSGKSTLASIICGMNRADSGEMTLFGEPYAPHSPVDANKRKVAMVVQELGILGSMPVAMNMFMGRMDEFKTCGIIHHKKMRQAAQAVYDKWDLGKVPAARMTGELSIEQRKILELARALSADPDILILDEITQALSHDLREKLYHIMDEFVRAGKTILLITHDMDEMLMLADNITVLRDGQVVGTKPKAEMTMDDLRRMMIGREINHAYYRNDEQESYSEDVILDVKGLGARGFHGVDFELHRGEILAVCGLSDAGIHDLGKALYGVAEHRVGKVTYVPKNTVISKPEQMLKTGGAYLSKDRDADGLMLLADIRENLIVPSLRELAGAMGYLSPRKASKLAQQAFDDFDIKATGLKHTVGRLSGGNKQKVNLSRWLVKDLNYIVLDCPTRGVDIGVKAYIYDLMRNLKSEGMAILMISDELPEAIGMADRIMIMKDGEVRKVMRRSEHFTEESIIEVMI